MQAIELTRGFLPKNDPLDNLPSECTAWEQIASQLPKLLISNQLRTLIEQLPKFPLSALKNEEQIERAMLILSYLGHAYVWGEKTVPEKLPKILAQPWYQVAQLLSRPPVLSYASYALNNWRRLNKSGPVETGNIALLQNFLGGADEEWFILIHVDIEAKAASALQACLQAIEATEKNDQNKLLSALQTVVNALEKICLTLERMPEHCDPYIYYHRVRPYIHGWKNNPAFPEGLVYEGVADYQNKPQQFRGETGAQSSIIPTMDGLLGITHKADTLGIYLQEMRDYMPVAHRAFINQIETSSKVREMVKQHRLNFPKLCDVYNHCVQLVERFRQIHLAYAASYIQKQAQHSEANPNAVGTGGTPFMTYLQKHRDETKTFLL